MLSAKKTVKLLVILCAAILAILFLIIFITKPIDTENTAQEAAQKHERTAIETIAEEKVKGGEVIYYTKDSYDYEKAIFAAGYVKKTIWGWEWGYGGGHGSINSTTKINGFSTQFFPAVKGTPFPLYFGAITNPEIDKIKVVEMQRNITNEAEISGSGDVRVWHIFMGNLKGSKFSIKAYSKDGKELSSVNEDVSPYSADQKPMRQQTAAEFLKALFGDKMK